MKLETMSDQPKGASANAWMNEKRERGQRERESDKDSAVAQSVAAVECPREGAPT